jgi:hypothetical protein
MAGGHRREVVGAEKIGQFVSDKVVVGLADDARLGRAVKLFEARIAGEINALGIFQPDQIRDGLDQGLEKTALALQRPAYFDFGLFNASLRKFTWITW